MGNTIYKNANDIRKAVDNGKVVYCDTDAYIVIKDSIGQYLIHFIDSDYYIGLTWMDKKTLNGTKFYSK